MQQGDVIIFDTSDGGEIEIEGGITAMDGGLRSAVYLSLFGGNEGDDGTHKNPNTWWGNYNEPDSAYRYVSETQYALNFLPPTTSNLVRLKDAVGNDLNWMISKGIARSINIDVLMPALNQVHITVTINESETYDFVENWKAIT